ncbi:MAG: DUF4395 domain-containing protein [Acidimicrobiia bacterium]
MKRLLGFPNPVNEVAARLVAAGALIMSLLVAVGHQWWVLPILAYGFVARVLTGPKLSPLGAIVTKVIVPRLRVEPKLVAGPPKRFAQGMGATMSVGALIGYLAGSHSVPVVLTAMIAVAATLESVFAFCLGCKVFALLMKVGIIPESVCAECNDISARLARASS